MEPGAAQPMPERHNLDHSRLAPLEVVIDLYFKNGALDEHLTYLMEWVTQRHSSIHLCCRKLNVSGLPIQNLNKHLKMVQLHCIQELEVSYNWQQPVLGTTVPHLEQMVNLHRIVISEVCMTSRGCSAEEVSQYASQMLRPNLLQELRLDCVFILNGRLDQVLRYLKSPLEALSVTCCQLKESDLIHLSLCANTSHLKKLDLCGVLMLYMSPETLKVLLAKLSATLQVLELDECGLSDAHFNAMLPALGSCSQLKSFSFFGNSISMPVLENLLRNTPSMRQFPLGLYPVPLEAYQGPHGSLHQGRLVELHARLKAMLQDLGQTRTILLGDSICFRCCDRIFYGPELILCRCHRRV
ncbi:melanoma antigen preferentially expressed in tumors-like [Tamandua tetradactyla]|uniref:melanoma antigen preferentially expressed in tumors-like n=1 Tax=Tamandua tetradactyla TaxID=48850 RepID=UPI00405445F3